ncbi:MAG: hypothetical protein CME06_14230 [Gemmatimonadetes bacterium]|nr:hypothetical protein [Gemmatimonadota bacterium]
MSARHNPLLLTLACLGGAASAKLVQPVVVPGPTGGNEHQKMGQYFGYPAPDSLLTVRANIDRGAPFYGPTDYPPERHTAFGSAMDTYFAAYEWDAANDFMVNTRYWDTVLGFGFWSSEGTPSEEGTQSDAGRPSLHGTADGMAIAYHGVAGPSDFQAYFNSFDSLSASWGESQLLADDINSPNFPFLDRSSTGTWMIVCNDGHIGDATGDVMVFLSDDTVTWTRSTVQQNAIMSWTLPTGASDPSNGDLYVAYSDDQDGDEDGDVVIHRSTDSGVTWSAQQLVAEGAPGGQAVVPSIVVDRDHRVHIIFQHNTSPTFEGLLSGFNEIGIAGPPQYVSGAFDGGNEWQGGVPAPLNPRANLVALPDSCGITPDSVTVATDTLTGMPQLGIYSGPSGDVLHATYNQTYLSISTEGGFSSCPPWQTWRQSYDLSDESGWSDRLQVSEIDVDQAIAGRNAMYAGITHDVPEAGPGIIWSEMHNAAGPSEVMFKRPLTVGIEDSGGGAPRVSAGALLHPAAPNPFNPMTRISYELTRAADVSLVVYDAAGRMVRMLERGWKAAGRHTIAWKGTNDQGVAVSSGVYFYRLDDGERVATRSMLLVK